GTAQEDYVLLRQAEEKIVRSIELCPENSETWALHGNCLCELGRYFHDVQFYIKAIEKFQYGLSINRTDPMLWYGMAYAHFAIGDLNGDHQMLEKSTRCCARVIEFGGQGFPQFWVDWGVALMKYGEATNDKGYVEAALDKFVQAISQTDEESVDPEW